MTMIRQAAAAALLLAGGASAEQAQLANPAAVFCEESGGTYQIVKSSDGDIGLCHLADGTSVDAWDHYRANWDKQSAKSN